MEEEVARMAHRLESASMYDSPAVWELLREICLPKDEPTVNASLQGGGGGGGAGAGSSEGGGGGGGQRSTMSLVEAIQVRVEFILIPTYW